MNCGQLTGESRLSVADISYSGNKTWLDPFSHFPYSIPDALDFTNTPSACFLESDTIIMNNSAAWEAEASMTGFFIGIGYDGFNIGIGFNKEMAHMQVRETKQPCHSLIPIPAPAPAPAP